MKFWLFRKLSFKPIFTRITWTDCGLSFETGHLRVAFTGSDSYVLQYYAEVWKEYKRKGRIYLLGVLQWLNAAHLSELNEQSETKIRLFENIINQPSVHLWNKSTVFVCPSLLNPNIWFSGHKIKIRGKDGLNLLHLNDCFLSPHNPPPSPECNKMKTNGISPLYLPPEHLFQMHTNTAGFCFLVSIWTARLSGESISAVWLTLKGFISQSCNCGASWETAATCPAASVAFLPTPFCQMQPRSQIYLPPNVWKMCLRWFYQRRKLPNVATFQDDYIWRSKVKEKFIKSNTTEYKND